MRYAKMATLGGVLLAVTMLLSGNAVAGVYKSTAVTWQLTDARVLGSGKSAATEEGTLITDYLVEATATATGESPVKLGQFRLSLTIFSPKKDMPGQKAGLWYLRGSWSITDEKAKMEAKKSRHHEAVVRGQLSSVLEFNPAANPGPIDAQIIIPASSIQGKMRRGGGAFSVDETFTGKLDVVLERWQDTNEEINGRREKQ